jgi:hypothetical protein
MVEERQPGPTRWSNTLVRAVMAPDADLTAQESASTLFRFFRSNHVADLRVIANLATCLIGLHTVLVALAGWMSTIGWSNFLTFLFTWLGPSLTIYGGIVAWTYLSAATRLGVVDLFASEISTLCRVGTIFDIGKHYVKLHDEPPPEEPTTTTKPAVGSVSSFVSQENYFPVFNDNSQDLQRLEAPVVRKITEFYTFMKAARDSQRRLGQTKPSQAAKTDAGTTETKTADPWREAVCNVIFMIYLGYESGRKAIEELIEYEPSAAENITVILLTELECYSFLCKHFEKDQLRHSRLEARRPIYKSIVPQLYKKVNSEHAHDDEDWIKAKNTLPELTVRYDQALGEGMDTAIC